MWNHQSWEATCSVTKSFASIPTRSSVGTSIPHAPTSQYLRATKRAIALGEPREHDSARFGSSERFGVLAQSFPRRGVSTERIPLCCQVLVGAGFGVRDARVVAVAAGRALLSGRVLEWLSPRAGFRGVMPAGSSRANPPDLDATETRNAPRGYSIRQIWRGLRRADRGSRARTP